MLIIDQTCKHCNSLNYQFKLDESLNSLKSNISNTELCLNIFSNTKNRVEYKTGSGVLVINFDVFGNMVTQCLECLIYYLLY